MGLFSRLRRGRTVRRGVVAAERGEASAHLERFARAHTGVEAYVEPATTVTPTTLLLVAHDGEWTRRAVPDPATATSFARRLGLPIYDVNLTGYPARMRAYNSRRKQDGAAGS
jgi:hypothetical protein